MGAVTTRFPSAKYQGRRKGQCPECGKSVLRTRVFECTANPFNTHPDGTPLTLIEVLAQARAEAAAWEPDFTHDKCRKEGS